MSSVLWRGVALGPGGIGDSQRYATNRRFYDETTAEVDVGGRPVLRLTGAEPDPLGARIELRWSLR